MAWREIEFYYPNPHVFSKHLLWLDKNANIYFGMKENYEDDYTYYAGTAGHALDTGLKLTEYATEALAQANWLTTARDTTTGKYLAILPGNVEAKHIALYVESGNNVVIYEWWPSVYISAHEIVAGQLLITSTLSDAPSIKIEVSAQERVFLGNIGGGVYGLRCRDASNNIVFQSDTSAQGLAGWTFLSTCLYKLTAGTVDPWNPTGVVINASNASAPIGLDIYSAGVLRFAAGEVAGGVYGIRCYDASSNILLQLDTSAATVAGWTTIPAAFYKLDSGTPTSSPTNGITLEITGGTNSKPVIRTYDGATLNAALGNYASGKYGIYAIEGEIGTWLINPTYLAKDTGIDNTSSGMAPADYPFYGGATYANRASAPFRVTPAGALTASSATITGSITATTGAIGGWNIISSCIYKVTAGTVDPWAAPTGVVINASNASAPIGIDVYNAGALRFAAGVVDTGVYGMRCYAADGTTVLLKVDSGGTLIAGFTIDSAEGLYAGSGATRVQMKPGAGIWTGATAIGDAPFSVTNAGLLKAISGTIGGWTLAATTLTGTGITLSSTGDAYVAIGTTPPTAPTVGTGIFINKTGLFGLSVNTQNFKIDATNGNITAIAGTIGAWTLGATTISATNITLTSGGVNVANILAGTGATAGGINSANVASDIVFWAGSTYANRATAPFRVEADGSLYASDATITGAIIATNIDIGGDDATSFHVDIDGNMWSGASIADKATAPFRVSNAGVLVATSATITGNLTLGGDDSVPNYILLNGSSYDSKIMTNAAGTNFYWIPVTDGFGNLLLGATSGAGIFDHAWNNVEINCDDQIVFTATGSTGYTAYLHLDGLNPAAEDWKIYAKLASDYVGISGWLKNDNKMSLYTKTGGSINLSPDGSASAVGRANFTAGGVHTFYNSAGAAQVIFDNGNIGMGKTSPGSLLDMKGTLRLSGSSSGYVGLAPAAAAGSTTYTLPAADGALGTVLGTSGAAVLSWVRTGMVDVRIYGAVCDGTTNDLSAFEAAYTAGHRAIYMPSTCRLRLTGGGTWTANTIPADLYIMGASQETSVIEVNTVASDYLIASTGVRLENVAIYDKGGADIATSIPGGANLARGIGIAMNAREDSITNFGGWYKQAVYYHTGTHYRGQHTPVAGSDTVLTDSGAAFGATNWLIGKTIYNQTEGNSGTVTSNTSTTITCSGGGLDWHQNDYYIVGVDQPGIGVDNAGFGDAVWVSSRAGGSGIRADVADGIGLLSYIADVYDVPAHATAFGLKIGTVTSTGKTIDATASVYLSYFEPRTNHTSIYIAPTVHTDFDLGIVSTTKTSREMINLYHSTSTWDSAGTGLLMNFAVGSGSFAGSFADFRVNSVSQFSVTYGGHVVMRETTAPSNTANYGKLYVKSSDSKLYFMNDAGGETCLTP